jgi:hypothetical protein
MSAMTTMRIDGWGLGYYVSVYSELPVNAIRGMRNRVVHEYREVDVKILWEVTQTRACFKTLMLPNRANAIRPYSPDFAVGANGIRPPKNKAIVGWK